MPRPGYGDPGFQSAAGHTKMRTAILIQAIRCRELLRKTYAMAASVSMPDRRSAVTAWVHQHLAVRRALPLAVLALWGCLVTLGLVIHPVTPRSPARESSAPFFAARGAGVDSVATLKLVWLHYYILTIPLLLYGLRPGAWIRPSTGASGPPRLRLALLGLLLALLALAAVFGRPFAYLIGPGPATSVSLYIGGAWGLMLLGLAGLWLPSSGLQPALEKSTTP